MSDEVGKIYGAWQVTKEISNTKLLCVCTACAETVQSIRKYDLQQGKSLMCKACAQKKNSHSKPIEYHSWVAMIQRCYNENSKDYPNYGGRGIEVCDLWRDSFEAFLMCVGKRPSPEYTIDRIDHNGNYEPGNVRWLTREEQTRNQRSNVNITIDGETKTVAEWAEDPRCSVSKFTVYKRLKRGWDPEKAVLAKSKAK